MLHFAYARDLERDTPELAQEMFRHRAVQFSQRLGWDVQVDGNGCERDSYDDDNPLYVIWRDARGHHAGSARFLPTTGPTMVNDHFSHLAGGTIRSPFIWECTRFCLAPGAEGRVGSALMLGGAELMRRFGLEHLLGVFDERMLRVYRIMGSTPDVLGLKGGIGAGLWHENAADRERLLARAKVAPQLLQIWSDAAFGPEHVERKAALSA